MSQHHDDDVSSTDQEAERYQQRMATKKRIVDERIAQADQERGVLIVLKGNGKGKSSSAFGTMARALGHGQRCAVIQFIKGRRATGEYLFFNEHPRVDFHVMGHGFSWEVRDPARERQAAQEAWTLAERLLRDPQYHFLLFDELSYMIKYGYLDAERIARALSERPAHQNVMITGRTMAREVQEIADTISVIQDERHAFRLGVKAQAGIEY
ncbi:cob(I)alamin adenosyltransferase [Kushneria pakistanensis]|uniref:Corrinoid adenosyltransferase n=1 Tax=Kushneria pakistanensis TaxID=1508770 RepID=A0ABQ3FDS8_9GAMM|nr:cob(I)yrinic acid a,c-diamide adenosyltransferase [Kushneria pakistanensis]GHC19735.1 cob(I)alamin adenosyltransferase [Kushneria pakistanensis]